MIIINVIGGLGNQMFQYAFYLALKEKHPSESIKVWTGAFRGYSKHNAFELEDVFRLKVKKASICDMLKISYPYVHYRLWQIGHHILPQRASMFKELIFGDFYPEVFNMSNCFFDGYWQNEDYFKDMRVDILRKFTFANIDQKNNEIAKEMASCHSASIHIRRGDFLKDPVYQGICSDDYYERAVNYLVRKTNIDKFYIFSNDIEWCKENITRYLCGIKHMYIDWNKGKNSYLDMYLMSKCHHNIIANSSFSWWGAWLNQHSDKIVIGPSKWNNLKDSEFKLPDEWVGI